MIVSSFVWAQYWNVTDGQTGYYSALHCEQYGRAGKMRLYWKTLLVTSDHREALWYYFGRFCLCVSLLECMYVCLSDDNFRKPWCICISGISLGNTGQVRIWRSSGHGQGHRSRKHPKCLFLQCKLWLKLCMSVCQTIILLSGSMCLHGVLD